MAAGDCGEGFSFSFSVVFALFAMSADCHNDTLKTTPKLSPALVVAGLFPH
jgi:hypothetical protein